MYRQTLLRGSRLSRRAVLRQAGLTSMGLAVAPQVVMAQATPGVVSRLEEVTIDLSGEPASLDPALAYEVNDWSVVHSIYDGLIQYGPEGQLQPLLAESLTATDVQTYEVRLRGGIFFHNGEPLDARAVGFSLAHLVDEETASQVAEQFRVIDAVEEVDSLTVRLLLREPAPWLPALMAAWFLMLPPDYAATEDFRAQPVGTGPYRFVAWNPGDSIVLEANPDYFAASPKGQPLADTVTYRFVPEASTRVADLLTGTADLIDSVPVDQLAVIEEEGAATLSQPVVGSAWVRIATDVEPFTDVRVRQALNFAVDVETIIEALLGGNGQRLANFYPEERALGFDPELAPYSYDPDRARALLAEAGLGDGFATTLEYTTTERQELVAAVAGQLEAVGLDVTLQPVEIAIFNQTWGDPAAAPLRFSTWRPLFDPYILLSLVVASDGFLSRYDNPEADALIEAAAVEPDAGQRAETYRQLGRVLHEAPAAIYLYSLTGHYGLTDRLDRWRPRADEYVIATAVEQGTS